MAEDQKEDVQEKKTESNEESEANIDKPCSKEERTEYFSKLEIWLQEAYTWQSVAAMFPYYLMSSQMLGAAGVPQFPIQVQPNIGISTSNVTQTNVNDRRNDNFQERRAREATGPVQPPGAEGYEYRIPPIWKRFVAEFIDSSMLFLLKLSITYIAIEVFDFIDMDDLDIFQTNLRIDYKMALEMTSGILILELIHRVIVCIFEAAWIQHGINGRIGGATPGKSMMGLRVVQCRNITPIERPDGTDTVVLVTPGTDLGLPLALGRSVVKNLILTFLFPICFAVFFFRFNRTGYDLFCSSIVVEDPYRIANNNRLPQQ